MIRTWQGKLFWSALGLGLGFWTIGRWRRGSKPGRKPVTGRAVGRDGQMARPYIKMAARAGKAMMNTTMRTVRTLGHR